MKYIRILRSPFVIMPLLMFSIVAGWFHYTRAISNYDVVAASSNLLPNPSFEEWLDFKPTGWNIENSEQNAQLSRVVGHVDGYGLRVDVGESDYGSITLASPITEVDEAQTYFFKTFYATDTQFDLYVRQYTADSVFETIHLKHYPDYDYPWSTMSDVVVPEPGVKQVQMLIVFSEMGYMELDSAYLVARDDVITPSSFSGSDLLDNSKWSFIQSGILSAKSSRNAGTKTVAVANHQIGQAAWVPKEVSVSGSTLMGVELEYSADTEVELGIDYTLSDGTTIYRVEKILQPVSELSKVYAELEIPRDVVAMAPSVQIYSDGRLTTGNIRLSEIKPPALFDKPRISITFDDGWLSSYENGADQLDERGYKGTYYINPGFLGSDGFVGADDVEDLMARGHQVGSHTQNHYDLTSYKEGFVADELITSKNYINGLGIDTIDFATPYGKYDHGILTAIKDSYVSHRSTEFGVNTKQNLDLFNLKTFFTRKDNIVELPDYIERAKRTNGWLILTYHQIEPSESMFAHDRGEFEEQLDLIERSGIEVMTVRQALEEISSK